GGNHSAYGKLVPIINNVSAPIIMSWLAVEPSSPIGPVTYGRSSGTTARPNEVLAIPAPRISAVWITSSTAPAAPWPTRIATLDPSLRTAAALSSSSSFGNTRGWDHP